jgi:hypothetical protein
MSLPMMFAQMAAASVETIARRTGMIFSGGCSAAEYRRMVGEKAKATVKTAAVMAKPQRKTPRQNHWRPGTVANAKRTPPETEVAQRPLSWFHSFGVIETGGMDGGGAAWVLGH